MEERDEALSLQATARFYGCRPSELLSDVNGFEALCLDEALFHFCLRERQDSEQEDEIKRERDEFYRQMKGK